MKRLQTLFIVLMMGGIFFHQSAMAQVDVYARAHTVPPVDPGIAWGEAIGGVDLDGDGKMEIYAVTTDLYDASAELVSPRICKYEYDGTSWNKVWSAVAPVERQNTWPALTVGDLDGDGRMEVIWGPVNNFTATSPNPYRVLVYEVKGDGSDTLGVPDGTGNFLPNAKTTIVSGDNTNLRPFRWAVADMKGDGMKELVFCSRAGADKFGILTVSDVPDNGDSSETWTEVIKSSDSSKVLGGTVYDMAVVDSSAFFFSTSGEAQAVLYRNGAFKIMPPQANVVPGGSWKTAMTTDIDSNGTKEIVIAAGGGDGSNRDVYLLQIQADTLAASKIATADASVARLFGGAQGDLDGDGKVDFVFASRASTPPGIITRLSYLGGDITSSGSYAMTTIDKGFGVGGERYDYLDMFNDGTNMNVMYGMGYGGDYDVPIVLLQKRTIPAAPAAIADVRKNDANGVPDSLNKTVTVIAEVTSANDVASSTQFVHYVQDETGGFEVFKSGVTTPPMYPRGQRLAITGTVGQYKGQTELLVSNLSTDIVDLGPAYRPMAPIVLTLAQFNADPEMYEDRLIQFKGVTKKATSAAWAPYANLSIWDGTDSTILFLNGAGLSIGDSAEVTYPINLTGIGTQYDGSSPYTSGYDVMPRDLNDFEQGVHTTVSGKFHLASPANNSRIVLDTSSQTLTFKWHPAFDLDGDSASYQWLPIGFTSEATGHDTMYTIDASTMLTYLAGQDSVDVKWYVKAQDPTASTGSSLIVTGVDTFMVRIVHGTITGVERADLLPTVYSLAQNYPNPFNPTTSIKFGIPNDSKVVLKVYNMLGQEVATLVNENKVRGYYTVPFNAGSLASGTYIYRIQAGSYVAVKKMLLLK